MDILLKILGILSIVLIATTIICGLWIKSHPQDDIQFHFVLSLSTVLVALVTIVLFMKFKL